MADSGGKVATYSIRFDSNAVETGKEGAASLEELKGSVGRSQEAIKTLSSAMRGLKGSSDEVKGAREQLKAQLEGERGALTAGTLALLKQGTSYDQLAAKEKAATAAAAKLRAEHEKHDAKKAAEEQLAATKAISAAGGPVSALRDKVTQLREAFSTSGGQMALFATAAAGIVAAIVAVGSAIASAAVDLGRWILETVNAQRNMALMREAWSGNATNAAHLGNQLDALAKKISTPKEQLNDLAGSLTRALSGTRVSGQGIVDTFNAVAQASAAMGDQAGKALEDIITRSKQFGRVSIGAFELQGTGIKRQDVAAQLAKNLHVGINDALLALATGRVKVDDAAKALREVVERRFGEVNAKKLISLESTLQKFKENLAGLTSGVHMEGLLRSLSKVGEMFSSSTITGQALKTIITTIGNILGGGFEGRLPVLQTIFLYTELAVLKTLIALKKFGKAIGDLTGSKEGIDIIGIGFSNAAAQAKGFADMADAAGRRIEDVVQLARDFSNAWTGATDKVTEAWSNFKDLGAQLVEGVINGIGAGVQRVKDTVVNLAETVKNAFKDALGIHSPSMVFEGYGKHTATGYERGVDKGAGKAQDAVERMTPQAPAAGAQAAAPGAGRGRPGPSAGAPAGGVHVHIHVPPGAQGAEVAKQLTAPNFLRDLTRAVEEALTMNGLPMQKGATP